MNGNFRQHITHSGSSSTGLRNPQIELEFGKVGFCGGRLGKQEDQDENPWSSDQNQQQTDRPYMASTLGIEPRPHWWEANALNTRASSLLPSRFNLYVIGSGYLGNTLAGILFLPEAIGET